MLPKLRVGGGAASRTDRGWVHGDTLRFVGLTLTAFLAGACGKILGLDEYAVSDGTGHEYSEPYGGISYKSESCRDCVVGSCPKEAKACSFDPGCTAMVQCLARCDPTDHDCRGTCNLGVVLSLGSDAFTDLVQCEANHGCGTCASARAVRHNESCDACLEDRCRDVIDAFSKDRAALQLDTCGCAGDAIDDARSFFVSGERPCVCEDTYGATGKANWDRVTECEAGPCQRECDLVSAGDWSCLGHQQVPPAPPFIDVGFTLLDILGGTPLPDFDVNACSALDSDCQEPLVSGRTDAWGQVYLNVPTAQPLGPFGYFLAVPDPATYHDAYPRTLRYISPVRYERYISPTRYEHSSYTTRDSYYATWSITSRAFNRATTMTLPKENQAILLPDGGNDRTRGGLILWLTSCYGDAPGVSLSGIDIPGLPHSPWAFYLDNDINLALDQTANNFSHVGLAISGDVPPQSYPLKASLAKDGSVVGNYGVLVQADAVTLITVGPVPSP